MKVFALLLLTIWSVSAQSPPPGSSAAPTNSPPAASEPIAASVQLRTATTVQQPKPGVSFSGGLIEAARSPNPLQMLNPRAPRSYGDGWSNVSVDPITGKAQGIKLFAISF